MRARHVEVLLEAEEKEKGQMHPHVGQACLVLSKLYMKAGGEEGLSKPHSYWAWNICRRSECIDTDLRC
jgi:hypothetical protein